jgi:hypothetical protein
MLLLVVLGIGQTFRRLEEEELFFLIKDVHIFHKGQICTGFLQEDTIPKMVKTSKLSYVGAVN